MMYQYHKIQTVYLRDPQTKFRTLLEGQYATPEFEFLALCPWAFTEKVDGTNIRIMIHPEDSPASVTFGGKTDRAQIPSDLVNRLNERFRPIEAQMHEKFTDGACLYGEGYGAKIQKGGGNYRPDQDFVLFDVRVGKWWLQRKDVEEVAESLGLDIVPIIGRATLPMMVEKAREGFNSEWGDFSAEGIVARPAIELVARNGKRIITKIKTKDFPRKP